MPKGEGIGKRGGVRLTKVLTVGVRLANSSHVFSLSAPFLLHIFSSPLATSLFPRHPTRASMADQAVLDAIEGALTGPPSPGADQQLFAAIQQLAGDTPPPAADTQQAAAALPPPAAPPVAAIPPPAAQPVDALPPPEAQPVAAPPPPAAAAPVHQQLPNPQQSQQAGSKLETFVVHKSYNPVIARHKLGPRKRKAEYFDETLQKPAYSIPTPQKATAECCYCSEEQPVAKMLAPHCPDNFVCLPCLTRGISFNFTDDLVNIFQCPCTVAPVSLAQLCKVTVLTADVEGAPSDDPFMFAHVTEHPPAVTSAARKAMKAVADQKVNSPRVKQLVVAYHRLKEIADKVKEFHTLLVHNNADDCPAWVWSDTTYVGRYYVKRKMYELWRVLLYARDLMIESRANKSPKEDMDVLRLTIQDIDKLLANANTCIDFDGAAVMADKIYQHCQNQGVRPSDACLYPITMLLLRPRDGKKEYGKAPTEIVVVCGDATCRRTTDKSLRCLECKKVTCAKCWNIAENDEHQCDPADLAFRAEVLSKSTQCPNCFAWTEHAGGCQQMMCTNVCGAVFDRNTGLPGKPSVDEINHTEIYHQKIAQGVIVPDVACNTPPLMTALLFINRFRQVFFLRPKTKSGALYEGYKPDASILRSLEVTFRKVNPGVSSGYLPSDCMPAQIHYILFVKLRSIAEAVRAYRKDGPYSNTSIPEPSPIAARYADYAIRLNSGNKNAHGTFFTAAMKNYAIRQYKDILVSMMDAVYGLLRAVTSPIKTGDPLPPNPTKQQRNTYYAVTIMNVLEIFSDFFEICRGFHHKTLQIKAATGVDPFAYLRDLWFQIEQLRVAVGSCWISRAALDAFAPDRTKAVPHLSFLITMVRE